MLAKPNVIINDIRLRGLAVAGSEAAGRKSPHNHTQTARNLKRSLRNAAAGARLIQAEGLDSKSAADVAASLADALEELPGSSAALIDVSGATKESGKAHQLAPRFRILITTTRMLFRHGRGLGRRDPDRPAALGVGCLCHHDVTTRPNLQFDKIGTREFRHGSQAPHFSILRGEASFGHFATGRTAHGRRVRQGATFLPFGRPWSAPVAAAECNETTVWDDDGVSVSVVRSRRQSPRSTHAGGP